MLDLTTAFGKNEYEIKLLDGRTLQLKRPTQAIQQTILEILPMVKDKEDEAKAIPLIVELFVRILNRNVNDIEFTNDEIEDEYSLEIMVYVIQDYFIHWNKEIADNVNFQQPQQ